MVQEQFIHYKNQAYKILGLNSLISESDFKTFTASDGNLPLIDDDLLNIISEYPDRNYSKCLNDIGILLLREVENNFLTLSNDYQLNSYCNRLLNDMDIILDWFKKMNYIDLIDQSRNIKDDEIAKLKVLNFSVKEKFTLQTLLNFIIEGYKCFNMISQTITSINQLMIVRGIIEQSSEPQSEQDINTNSEGVRTFKSLFKNHDVYHALIDFLATKKLISINYNKFIWKGFRSNSKYEIASFHEALYTCGLISKKATTDTDLASIAMNTFYNFEVSERTMRNEAYKEKIDDYIKIIKEFKKSTP